MVAHISPPTQTTPPHQPTPPKHTTVTLKTLSGKLIFEYNLILTQLAEIRKRTTFLDAIASHAVRKTVSQ